MQAGDIITRMCQNNFLILLAVYTAVSVNIYLLSIYSYCQYIYLLSIYTYRQYNDYIDTKYGQSTHTLRVTTSQLWTLAL